MSLHALRRALDASDEQHARRVIRACGAGLRERGVQDEDDAALVAELRLLSTHASATVRRAVADVCDALPDPAFDEVHERLLADGDPFVQRSAEASGHRRAQARLRQAKVKADDDAFDDLLDEIGRRNREARRLAERAIDRGVERFARSLVHEVDKTRDAVELSLLKLQAEIDRPDRSAARMQEQVALLRERTAFVYAIVRRATEYATQHNASFEEEALEPIVREAAAQLLGRMKARAPKVALSVEVDAALRMDLDRHAMKQALQNVLQNAVEAYPAGAERFPVRVVARALRGSSEIELAVSDEGVGIPEDQMPSLFVPFGSRKPGGTGVGMLIVQRMIVEVHGGKLDVASPPGKGTTVTMVLPAKQGRA